MDNKTLVYRSKYDWSNLEELYIAQELSMREIAKIKGCSKLTVNDRLIRAGIARRPPLESLSNRKQKIQEAYWEEELSIPEVAEKLGISVSTVARYLGKGREPSDAQKVRYKDGRLPNNFKGRVRCAHGYIKVYAPNHPHKMNDNCIYEHILTWEETHQKLLPKGWCVHHINGIKDDNRPENLVAMPRGKHSKIIPEMATRIHNLEIENRQLRQALEDRQSIFYIGEN